MHAYARRVAAGLALICFAIAAQNVAAAAKPASAPGHKPSPSPSPTSTTSSPSPTPTTSTTSPSPTPTTTSPSPTPTTTSPSSSCGGTAIPKSTGGYWTCTFDDEFDGSTVDTGKWTVVTTASTGFHSGQECFVNSPNNVSIANGILSLTVRQEAAPFVCTDPSGNYTTQYTSGSLMSYGKFSQTYGRFEVRAAFPATTVEGLQSALWLYPVNGAKFGAWPTSGEIDIAEEYSLYADRAIPYVHYVPAVADPNVTNNYCMITNVAAFHDYTVEWTPTTITISYDGHTCITDNWNPAAPLVKPEPFNQPFFVTLTQALGIGGNAFTPGVTPLPATTQVDYVRAWA